MLDQADDFVDFKCGLALPTLFFRRIRHAGPSVGTSVRDLPVVPEYGARVCGVWTHSETPYNILVLREKSTHTRTQFVLNIFSQVRSSLGVVQKSTPYAEKKIFKIIRL